ncbi:hypothetical protein RI367_003324 [Sorochytrium milnesiophthora]
MLSHKVTQGRYRAVGLLDKPSGSAAACSTSQELSRPHDSKQSARNKASTSTASSTPSSLTPSPTVLPLDPAYFDLSVRPQDNFYKYANQGWLNRTKIPADKARYGAFDIVGDSTDKQLKTLLEEEKEKTGSIIGDFYRSGMDEKRINADGVQPIQDLLDAIARIASPKDAVELVARLLSESIAKPLFTLSQYGDAKRSDWSVMYIHSAGLGLPDREYYVSADEDKKKIREKYIEHIAKMFELANFATGNDAKTKAQKAFAFELVLARASLTKVEQRDPHKTYNKLQLTELEKVAPNFPWAHFWQTLGANDLGDYVLVSHVPYLTTVSDLISGSQEGGTWEHFQAYLAFHLLNGMAPTLSEDLVKEDFSFTLSGTLEMKPRWKRVLAVVGEYADDALGEQYVARYFSAKAKADILNLVKYIISAFEDRLRTLQWIGEETRTKALEKLSKLSVKVGYPDKWDYEGLKGKISAEAHYATNRRIAGAFFFQRWLKRINKPFDRSLWHLPTHQVNAALIPLMNEIVFPAAILQPPFYYPPTKENPYGDVAVNLGGIGAVIGHEITHGYDDQGSEYDAHGKLSNWWSEQDKKNFSERTKVIVEQYNGFKFFDQPVNGELTQGENIADVGCLSIAYAALKKWQAANPGAELPHHSNGPRFTQEQRLHLAWAQLWRSHIRKEAALVRLVADEHSPDMWRVNGVLPNLKEFYEVWGVKPGDGMWLDENKRVAIWNL